MRDLAELFQALRRSRFRRQIRLASGDQRYLNSRSADVVQQHARKFISERLAVADPPNDGRQTPWRGHPVFSAQHATATCCRKCLAKWHQIPPGRPMSDDEIDYVVLVIETWLESFRDSPSSHSLMRQQTLFDAKGDSSPRN